MAMGVFQKELVNAQERPGRLFRYFPPEASDIFAVRKLWLSAAAEFNDLFEVVPRYDSLLSKSIEDALRKEFAFLPPSIPVDWPTYKRHMSRSTCQLYRDGIETLPQGLQDKFSEHFGIICFSTNLNSLAMWGHYARRHEGFVVEFQPDHSILPPAEFGKIIYSADRPAAENREYWRIVLTKSPEWSYESEYRLIKPLSGTGRTTRRDGKEKHFVELPFDAVRAIYFGCRICDDACAEILRDLGSDHWRHVKKYAMRRHPTQYAVEGVPWEKLQSSLGVVRRDYDMLWKALGL